MARHLILAGMQRSGTTWLYHMLDQHPSIHMAKPVRPELKFFLLPDRVAQGYQAYRECFPEAGSDFEGWLGEKSTSYSEFRSLPAAMAQLFGQTHEVRIVFILREPVARAVSNVRFNRQNGRETRDVVQALAESLRGPRRKLGVAGAATSVDPLAYLERGLYWQQLESYWDAFGAESVRILLSEQALGNRSSIDGIFGWLGLSQQVTLDGVDVPLNDTREVQGAPRGNGEIPQGLHEELTAFYERPNWELALGAGLDLSAWRNGQ